MQKLTENFMTRLKEEFSKDFFTQNVDELRKFGKDWTRVYEPNPSGVVFPSTTEEVAHFLRLCSAHHVYVVPSGGRTGLAGGAVAASGEIVLSLNRMNHMEPVDILAQTVRVQAGAVTEAVHQHCLFHGLTWPIDFASKGSSHVGGNIATNAGGMKVIYYGLTRDWVLGLQIVLMDGSVLELNGALEKNNTGIDLRQVFIGSEGILGVITEATLKLTRLPGDLKVFFFALNSIQEVLHLFQEARKASFDILAFEFLTHPCLRLVTEVRGLKSPFHREYPTYVLLEVLKPGSLHANERLDHWLEGLFQRGVVSDGVLAQSPREAEALWTLRESISESLSVRGFVHKNDIALPIFNLKNFIDEMYFLFENRELKVEIFLFGHIGDGNLHVNTMKPDAMKREEFIELCRAMDQELFQLVKKFHGSVSAEHGIGLLKKNALHFSRSTEELTLMQGLKKVFDPQALLNFGKIFN